MFEDVFTLANKAYKALPRILKRKNIEVQGRLIRKFVNRYLIKIYGIAKVKGRRVLLLGEVDIKPSEKEVRRFKRVAKKVKEIEGKEAILLFVAHNYTPEVEELLKREGILYFWSYEF